MKYMEDNDKVALSIIIPVYKIKEIFLRQCIESCVNQTYKNIEIILIDDGSPDNCGIICDEYAAMDNRIVVIHKDNDGVSSARNVGISKATGKYITFVDSDDWIETDACEKIINEINSSIDLLFFSLIKEYSTESFFSNDLYLDKCIFEKESIIALRKDILEKKLDRNVLRMTFCKVIRTEILKENTIQFDEKIPLCEDVVFWFEVFQHVKKAIYLNQCLYHYRQVENSATDRFRYRADEEHNTMLNRLSSLINMTDTPEMYRDGYYLEVFYSMQRCITQLFFHPDNTEKYFERVKKCHKYFSQEPYESAMKYINKNLLTSNHKIKYIIMKLKLYGVVQQFRKIYMIFTKRNLS